MLPAVNPLITRSFSIRAKPKSPRCSRETERQRTIPKAEFRFVQFCTRKQRCNAQQTFPDLSKLLSLISALAAGSAATVATRSRVSLATVARSNSPAVLQKHRRFRSRKIGIGHWQYSTGRAHTNRARLTNYRSWDTTCCRLRDRARFRCKRSATRLSARSHEP